MSGAAVEISTGLLPSRLPALGHVKLGGLRPAVRSAKGKDFQPPVKFDHFVVTTRERGEDGNLIRHAGIHERLGTEKPTELDVRLPFDTPPENFYAQMVQYKGRTRTYQCDGETGTDLSTSVSAMCPRRAGRECSCKPYGRLSVMLEADPTFGGVYVFRTTSWESTNNIATFLRMLHRELGLPSLRGLPLRLVCYPAEVRFKGSDGKDATGTAYKAGLVLRASYEEAAQAAIEFHRSHQRARRELKQLAAGTAASLDAMDAEEGAAIRDEFFPPARQLPAPRGGTSKLAAINAEIVGAEPPAPTDPVEPAVGQLRALLARAMDRGGLTQKQQDRIKAAIEGRDEGTVRAATDWLAGALEGGSAAAPGAPLSDPEAQEMTAVFQRAAELGVISSEESMTLGGRILSGDHAGLREELARVQTAMDEAIAGAGAA